MNASDIFLDFHGHLDCLVLDSLLLKLKKTKKFEDLNTTTRKRTYSVLVECVENIIRHADLKSSDDNDVQPYVSVRNENDKIVILAGNPISEETRDKLALMIENINTRNMEELKQLHEFSINKESGQGENGAGLGFISMASKSGNKLGYRFHPLISGYLNFEIQISLNK